MSNNQQSSYHDDVSDKRISADLAQDTKAPDEPTRYEHDYLSNDAKWYVGYQRYSWGLFDSFGEYKNTIRALASNIFRVRHIIRSKIHNVISWNTGGFSEEGKN